MLRDKVARTGVDPKRVIKKADADQNHAMMVGDKQVVVLVMALVFFNHLSAQDFGRIYFESGGKRTGIMAVVLLSVLFSPELQAQMPLDFLKSWLSEAKTGNQAMLAWSFIGQLRKVVDEQESEYKKKDLKVGGLQKEFRVLSNKLAGKDYMSWTMQEQAEWNERKGEVDGKIKELEELLKQRKRNLGLLHRLQEIEIKRQNFEVQEQTFQGQYQSTPKEGNEVGLSRWQVIKLILAFLAAITLLYFLFNKAMMAKGIQINNGGVDLTTSGMDFRSSGAIDRAMMQSLPDVKPGDVIGIQIRGITITPVPNVYRLLGWNDDGTPASGSSEERRELSYAVGKES